MKKFHPITVFLLVLVCVGCSRKEEPPQNLHLMAALRTAVSAKNTQWLAQSKTAFEKAVSQKKISEETAEEFREIFAVAESGDWETAESHVVKLQKGSKPTTDGSHDHAH